MSLRVISNTFKKDQVRGLNKLINKIEETKERGLRFHKRHLDSSWIVSLSDVSFGNNLDSSLQLRHPIVLGDNTGRANVLYYGNH